jgi:hypothetical protein
VAFVTIRNNEYNLQNKLYEDPNFIHYLISSCLNLYAIRELLIVNVMLCLIWRGENFSIPKMAHQFSLDI